MSRKRAFKTFESGRDLFLKQRLTSQVFLKHFTKSGIIKFVSTLTLICFVSSNVSAFSFCDIESTSSIAGYCETLREGSVAAIYGEMVRSRNRQIRTRRAASLGTITEEVYLTEDCDVRRFLQEGASSSDSKRYANWHNHATAVGWVIEPGIGTLTDGLILLSKLIRINPEYGSEENKQRIAKRIAECLSRGIVSRAMEVFWSLREVNPEYVSEETLKRSKRCMLEELNKILSEPGPGRFDVNRASNILDALIQFIGILVTEDEFNELLTRLLAYDGADIEKYVRMKLPNFRKIPSPKGVEDEPEEELFARLVKSYSEDDAKRKNIVKGAILTVLGKAVEKVAIFATEERYEWLKGLVAHENSAIRQAALYALGQFAKVDERYAGRESLNVALYMIGDEKEEVRLAALNALRKIIDKNEKRAKDECVFNAVRKLILDPDTDVRGAARKLLSKLCDLRGEEIEFTEEERLQNEADSLLSDEAHLQVFDDPSKICLKLGGSWRVFEVNDRTFHQADMVASGISYDYSWTRGLDSWEEERVGFKLLNELVKRDSRYADKAAAIMVGQLNGSCRDYNDTVAKVVNAHIGLSELISYRNEYANDDSLKAALKTFTVRSSEWQYRGAFLNLLAKYAEVKPEEYGFFLDLLMEIEETIGDPTPDVVRHKVRWLKDEILRRIEEGEKGPSIFKERTPQARGESRGSEGASKGASLGDIPLAIVTTPKALALAASLEELEDVLFGEANVELYVTVGNDAKKESVLEFLKTSEKIAAHLREADEPRIHLIKSNTPQKACVEATGGLLGKQNGRQKSGHEAQDKIGLLFTAEDEQVAEILTRGTQIKCYKARGDFKNTVNYGLLRGAVFHMLTGKIISGMSVDSGVVTFAPVSARQLAETLSRERFAVLAQSQAA